MTEPNQSQQEFKDAMEEAKRISETHSWLYGSFNVRCTMCHVSKGDMRSLEECPGPGV